MAVDLAELERRLESGESLRAIAADWGTTYQTLQFHRRKAGLPPLRAARTKGAEHASWRGGFTVDRYGYLMRRVQRDGRSNPYMYEHTLVAEETLGRPLVKGEVVHHIDGEKQNNSPDNLAVLSYTDHKRAHWELEEIAMEMVRNGEVVWRDGHYSRVR